MAAILPSAESGYLPYFLLYASISAIIHSAVCYSSPPEVSLTQFQGPSAPSPSSLLAHVYAVKNIYTGAIRLYAAYDIANEALYNLAIITFAGVLGLYGLERFVYGTVRNEEGIFPLVTAGLGLAWMVSQKGAYVA